MEGLIFLFFFKSRGILGLSLSVLQSCPREMEGLILGVLRAIQKLFDLILNEKKNDGLSKFNFQNGFPMQMYRTVKTTDKPAASSGNSYFC